MSVGRARHTQTLLPNGKVLIAGGGWHQGPLHNISATAELYDPATRAFSTTSNMVASREAHTATLLPGGKVLLAGGYSNESGVLASAEVYDPATGAFTATGSMTTAREYHTAVPLANGKVLITGGDDGISSLATGELYDPATGTFSATAAMSVARSGHTATLLADGRILFAGGGNDVTVAELYDPSAGAFSVTGSLRVGRANHTAALLGNGKVLIAGGYSSRLGGALTEAELFDPATGAFTQTGSLGTPRYRHAAVALGDGTVLELGGADASVTLTSAEVYNPGPGTFSATWMMAQPRYYASATVLADGSVLIAGGDNGQQGASAVIQEAETLPSPAASSEARSARFTVSNPVPAITGLSTNTAPAGSKVTLTGTNFNMASDILVNGVAVPGYGDPNLPTQIYFYPSLAGSFTVAVINPGPGGGVSNAMNLTVTVAVQITPTIALWVPGSMNQLTATVSGGPDTSVTWSVKEGPVGGSVDGNGIYTAPQAPGTYHVVATSNADPSQFAVATVQVGSGAGQMTTVGRTTTQRHNHAATLLNDGKVLIAGGGYWNQELASAEVYDPSTGQFTSTGSMGTARFRFAATRLRDGRVLVTGGNNSSDSGHTSPLASAELYDPVTSSFSPTGSMVNSNADHSAILLPDGKVLIVGGGDAELYDPAVGTFSLTGAMVTPRNGCMAILLANGKVLIAGGWDASINYLQSAELYDPNTGTFSATGSLTVPRATCCPFRNQATLLDNGGALIFGGYWPEAGLGSADLYEPTTGTFRATSAAPAYPVQVGPSVVLLANGLAYIAGGYMVNGSFSSSTHKTEFYDPATDAFYAGPLMSGLHDNGSTATVLANGSVLLIGGVGNDGTVDLYTPPPYDPVSAHAEPLHGASRESQFSTAGVATPAPHGSCSISRRLAVDAARQVPVPREQ